MFTITGSWPPPLWYHEHTLGITRLNIISGLAGLYLLRDDHDTGGPPAANPGKPLPGENTLGLPGPATGHGSGPFYEIPLLIQDLAFNTDGSLAYPTKALTRTSINSGCRISSETSSVSTARPGLISRWNRGATGSACLNACNSRLLNLSLDSHQPLWQIGSDGGFLPQVVPLKHLRLAPAERADLILDFTALADGTITLLNDAKTPFMEGETPDPQTTGQIMQFRVAQRRLWR